MVNTVVFDVGNVLIHWEPRALFRKLLPDEAAIDAFFAEVTPPEWNLAQDAGRRWVDAVAERVALFPEHADLIRAWDERWQEMVPGAIEGSVAILERLKGDGVPLYAITNFSAEKWAESTERFPFLANSFIGAVVSAHERVVKPDPEIFHRLLNRNRLSAADCVFIDDSEKNIAAARGVGMEAIHFVGHQDMAERLRGYGFSA